ncbi:hypothetical protein ACSSS7_001127 [Eimeria intestinalis]
MGNICTHKKGGTGEKASTHRGGAKAGDREAEELAQRQSEVGPSTVLFFQHDYLENDEGAADADCGEGCIKEPEVIEGVESSGDE